MTVLKDPRVFPPRYFVGWVDLDVARAGPRRINFVNALLIPVDLRRACVFAGSRRSAFYGLPPGDRLQGRVREIQYAISALDLAQGPVISKFNHPFAETVWLFRDGHYYTIVAPTTSGPLFRVQPLDTVLAHVASRLPCVQFIA